MRCPKCGSQDDKVLDSRAAREGEAIRRRRACLDCGERFTTYEEIVKDALRVVKRNGVREEFNRLKLLSGLMRACEKRPISPQQIEDLVTEIVEEVEQSEQGEVTTQRIGQLVMDKLQRLDDVAYIRFASVYRRFADVSQFLNAVKDIVGEDEQAGGRKS